MFKAIENGKIIAINETGKFPCLNYDSIEEDTEHQVSDYVHCNSQFVLTTSDPAIEQYKEQVRYVRNKYLKQTDEFMIVDYPITEDKRELYKQYREYLRHYPEHADWYKQNPLDFDNWLAGQA